MEEREAERGKRAVLIDQIPSLTSIFTAVKLYRCVNAIKAVYWLGEVGVAKRCDSCLASHLAYM